MAGMSGISMFRTSGSGYNSFIVVAGCLDLTGFEVITTLTISTLFANFSTSGSLGF